LALEKDPSIDIGKVEKDPSIDFGELEKDPLLEYLEIELEANPSIHFGEFEKDRFIDFGEVEKDPYWYRIGIHGLPLSRNKHNPNQAHPDYQIKLILTIPRVLRGFNHEIFEEQLIRALTNILCLLVLRTMK
jgi:hypothetical protein